MEETNSLLSRILIIFLSLGLFISFPVSNVYCQEEAEEEIEEEEEESEDEEDEEESEDEEDDEEAVVGEGEFVYVPATEVETGVASIDDPIRESQIGRASCRERV